MKLENSLGREDLKYTGETIKNLPVSDTFAVLKYKKDGLEYTDRGSLDDCLLLNQTGQREIVKDDGTYYFKGNWQKGRMNGEGLTTYEKDSYGEEKDPYGEESDESVKETEEVADPLKKT